MLLVVGIVKPEKNLHNNITKKLENMETELTSARNEIAKLNKVISSTKAENYNLRSRLNSCSWNDKKLKTQLEQARKTETRIKEMEKQVKTATEAKHVSEEEMKKLIEEIEHHRQITTQLMSEKENLRKFAEEKTSAEEKITNLTADVSQHNQTIEQLVSENENLKIVAKQKNETEKKMRTLMIEVDQYCKTIEEVRVEREHLQQEIQRCNQEILNMKKENETPLKPNSSEKAEEKEPIIRQNIAASRLQLDCANAPIDRAEGRKSRRKEKETVNKKLAVFEKDKKEISLMKQSAHDNLKLEREKNEERNRLSTQIQLANEARDQMCSSTTDRALETSNALATVIKEKVALDKEVNSLKNDNIDLKRELKQSNMKRDELCAQLASTKKGTKKVMNKLMEITKDRDDLKEITNSLTTENLRLCCELEKSNETRNEISLRLVSAEKRAEKTLNDLAMVKQSKDHSKELVTLKKSRDELASQLASAKVKANEMAVAKEEIVKLRDITNFLKVKHMGLEKQLTNANKKPQKVTEQLRRDSQRKRPVEN